MGLPSTALEIAARIREGELRATEVIEEVFAKIRESNQRINAIIEINEKALEDAKRIDSLSQDQLSALPLAGVPIAVKCNIHVKGLRVSAASRMLANYVSSYDATVISRLKKYGTIIIGLTNADEFAMGSTTENSFFGPTRNPIDPERVPGGSSGGSAAAVAAGYVPIAIGSDTGGSIRCPACYCGIIGLKPTYGRVSRYGLIAYANTLEQIGPMAKDFDDLWVTFKAIAGKDPRDATTVDHAVPENYEVVDNPRIAVLKESLEPPTDKRIASLILDKLSHIKADEVSIKSLEKSVAAYYVIAMAEASSNLARYDGIRYGFQATGSGKLVEHVCKTRAEGFGEEVKKRILLGTFVLSAGYAGQYYLRALKVREMLRDEILRILSKYDALVTPTMPTLPFKIGEVQDAITLYKTDILTTFVNLAGVPAISIPIGKIDNLPVGLQVICAPFREDLVVGIARWLQTTK
ncbi:MAG: Asp-tRNA(Asn)/Glu-tRNA(Gln) amidotransferase subunit GatA [Candidatus Korarchaeota archaeon]